MYGLIGKITAAPGQRDALAAILLGGTGAMPGCLSYIVATDPSDLDALWAPIGGYGLPGRAPWWPSRISQVCTTTGTGPARDFSLCWRSLRRKNSLVRWQAVLDQSGIRSFMS